MGLEAHRVHAGVGTASSRPLHQHVVHVGLLVIDGLRSSVPGHLQALGNPIDRQHLLRTEQEGASDRKLPHRAAPPNGDRIARLNVAVFSGHVAGRENVREEQDLLIGQSVFDFDRADVGKRHSSIFRLSAGEAAGEV